MYIDSASASFRSASHSCPPENPCSRKGGSSSSRACRPRARCSSSSARSPACRHAAYWPLLCTFVGMISRTRRASSVSLSRSSARTRQRSSS